MKTFIALVVGAVALLSSGFALAQSGNMMNGGGGWGGGGWMGGGWMGGGYGGPWIPILLIVIVIGFIAWIVTRGRK